jgi:hypothetical protein
MGRRQKAVGKKAGGKKAKVGRRFAVAELFSCTSASSQIFSTF